MDIDDKATEKAFLWLRDHLELKPSGAQGEMTWRAEIAEVYDDYLRALRRSAEGAVSKAVFWECIQLLSPDSELIGGVSKAVTAVRYLRHGIQPNEGRNAS